MTNDPPLDVLDWCERDDAWFADSHPDGAYYRIQTTYTRDVTTGSGIVATNVTVWVCDFFEKRRAPLRYIGSSYDLAKVKEAAAADQTIRRLRLLHSALFTPRWHPAEELDDFLASIDKCPGTLENVENPEV